MRIGACDTVERVLVIAEVGNNHEGDIGRAREMVAAAAEAGADAVKFQTYRTEHYVSAADPARFSLLKRFELSQDDFITLKLEADRQGILFLSTPFDLGSAHFLNELVPAFKIASGDNTFPQLLGCIAGFAKPVLLSCGLLSQNEICNSVALLRAEWAQRGVSPGLAVLHCISSYPAPEHEVHLNSMLPVAEAVAAVPGYSDHTLGTKAALLAVACGARIIEKHFTLDKQLSNFRDHQLSADPTEFKELMGLIRQAEVILGTTAKCLRTCETNIMPQVRRSAAMARSKPAGSALCHEDLTWVRPGGGFAPDSEASLIGRTLARNVSAFEVLHREMLED